MLSPTPYTHHSNTGDIEGSVLPAGKDTVLITPEGTPPALIEKIIMESLSGLELATISRSDSVMGERIAYQPIFNLSEIARRYNPKNITYPHGALAKYAMSLWRHVQDEEPVTESDGVITTILHDLSPGNLVEISIAVHGETEFFLDTPDPEAP